MALVSCGYLQEFPAEIACDEDALDVDGGTRTARFMLLHHCLLSSRRVSVSS